MIYYKLVKLIEDNADELTKRVCNDLLSREETEGYRGISKDIICERTSDVYRRLVSWLRKEKMFHDGDIKKYYMDLGKRRFHEGIPFSTVAMEFMLEKRHLWLFVTEKQFFDSTYECYQALELNNKVVLFFDRIIYFAGLGYEDELCKAGDENAGVFAKLLKKK